MEDLIGLTFWKYLEECKDEPVELVRRLTHSNAARVLLYMMHRLFPTMQSFSMYTYMYMYISTVVFIYGIATLIKPQFLPKLGDVR